MLNQTQGQTKSDTIKRIAVCDYIEQISGV